MMDLISGKKTYLTGGAMILYGITGVFLGNLDANAGMELVAQGFGIIFLRQGIAKVT